jgi:midasin (ATPase involved in ribosome maturation)
VETVDTLKYSYILNIFYEMNEPILLVGESGIGKTKVINNMIKTLQNSNFLIL